ncbi:MAG: winged helix-turn-helix domain-containing protein [Planctomycetia bacterium]|nr:winged helix-turn-helix domain-containing protein [Planctomycetia bacterium]
MNKKLKVGAAELKLPEKKVKGDKKPSWKVKTGSTNGKKSQVETPESVGKTEPTSPPEPTDAATLATSPNAGVVESATAEEVAITNETVESAGNVPEPPEEPDTKKPRKLKVKADIKPKKLSMIAAALQVLKARKVAMTCPELIDVMATEGLWVSPGGKTPANTLFAAISRDIKDKGKASAFRNTDRGRFEAVLQLAKRKRPSRHKGTAPRSMPSVSYQTIRGYLEPRRGRD